MHTRKLISNKACGIGLESKGNQVEHRMDEFIRCFVVCIQAKPLGTHFRTGYV